MKDKSLKEFAFVIFGAVTTACVLAGCVTTTPSSQVDENDLNGTYKVIDQSRRNSLQAETVKIKFFRNDPDVGGGLSAGYLTLTGPSVPDGWAYPVCGYPGDDARNILAGKADPANIEVIRCMNPKSPRSMPVAFLIKTRDGSPFHYSTGLLDVFNKSLEVTTGRLLVINWGPQIRSVYVLKAD
jgi:hypothetical protein